MLTGYHIPLILVEKAYYTETHDVFYQRPPAMEVAYQRAIGNHAPIGMALSVRVAAWSKDELNVSSSLEVAKPQQ